MILEMRRCNMMQSHIISYAATYTYIYILLYIYIHISYTIMSIHGMDPSKHQRHQWDPWGLVPANADGERLWLVPSPAKGFFLSGRAKNVKKHRKTKENDLQMMGDDGLYSSIHVLKGSNLRDHPPNNTDEKITLIFGNTVKDQAILWPLFWDPLA